MRDFNQTPADFAGDLPAMQRYVEHKIEKVRVQADFNISAMLMRSKVDVFETASYDLVLRLSSFVHAHEKHRLKIDKKWPKTWWDHFKLRWFWPWMLRRWPVEYEELHVDKQIMFCCPHIQDDDREKHLRWMCAEQVPPSQ